MLIAVFPVQTSAVSMKDIVKDGSIIYTYSEEVIQYLNKKEIAKVKEILADNLQSTMVLENQVYSILDDKQNIFIKYTINESTVNVLLVKHVT